MANIFRENSIRISAIIGYLLLFVAVTIAYLNPATGYEHSIIDHTPKSVYFIIVLSIFINTLAAVKYNNKHNLFIIAFGGFITILMPIIRGYAYLGEFDSLTQLGWGRDIAINNIKPTYLFYPGLHELSANIFAVSSYPLRTSFMISIYVFVLLFIMSTYIIIRNLGTSKYRHVIAIYTAILLVPINGVKAPILQSIPNTVATLYTGFVLLLFTLYIEYKRPRSIRIITVVAIPGLVLFHPQQALAFILAGSIMLVMQPELKLNQIFNNITNNVALISYSLLVVGIWITWNELFLSQAIHVAGYLKDLSLGAGIEKASSSATTTGQSFSVLILKAFTVSIVYCVVGLMWTGFVLISQIYNINNISTKSSFYLIMGCIPISFFIFAYILTGRTMQYFRYIGTILIFVSIIAAIGFDKLIYYNNSSMWEKQTISVVFLLLLILTIPIYYPTAWVSKPTGHVTESKFTGYNTMFEYADDDVKFVEIYSPVFRYRDALLGRSKSRFGLSGVRPARKAVDPSGRFLYAKIPTHFANHTLADEYNGSRYLPITSSDRYRAIKLHNGSAYSKRGFHYVKRSFNKPYSNNDMSVFYLS